jgi:hypothetical protein
MKGLLVLSFVLALGATAAAEPVKLTDTQLDKVVAGALHDRTTNPGSQPGGCSNNPNCTTVTLNPSDKPPPGHNK